MLSSFIARSAFAALTGIVGISRFESMRQTRSLCFCRTATIQFLQLGACLYRRPIRGFLRRRFPVPHHYPPVGRGPARYRRNPGCRATQSSLLSSGRCSMGGRQVERRPSASGPSSKPRWSCSGMRPERARLMRTVRLSTPAATFSAARRRDSCSTRCRTRSPHSHRLAALASTIGGLKLEPPG